MDRLRVSVIIKTFNEAANIARAIESALAATAQLDAEIIVADSLSDDATVAIAGRYPVKVVQLTDRGDRSCGAGAQLGFQYAQGAFLYILDGDMALDRGFFAPALAALAAQPELAGVAGRIAEESDSLEYRSRALRGDPTLDPGPVDRLNGGGLYRREALESVGYFTDPNLHAFEEFDLALRLSRAGWRLARLPIPGVTHRGHRVAPTRLLGARWRSGYAFGSGELLRAGIAHGYLGRTMMELRMLFAVLIWWIVLAATSIASFAAPRAWWAFLVTLAVPPAVMMVRKRGLKLGLYAVAAWCVMAAGLLTGLTRARRNPHATIASRVIHSHRKAELSRDQRV